MIVLLVRMYVRACVCVCKTILLKYTQDLYKFVPYNKNSNHTYRSSAPWDLFKYFG